MAEPNAGAVVLGIVSGIVALIVAYIKRRWKKRDEAESEDRNAIRDYIVADRAGDKRGVSDAIRRLHKHKR